MIKRVKAKDINPETMRLVRLGVGNNADIEVVGRVCDRNGNAESIRIELDSGAVFLCAPNEMIRVEMIETKPAPTTTTITIEVPAGSERGMREALERLGDAMAGKDWIAAKSLVPAIRVLRDREPDRANQRVQCGSCDAGLPMDCVCSDLNLANIDVVFGPHAFAPGYSGMTCEYAVLRADGTGDTCGLPPFAIEHTVLVRTANPMRTDAERHEAHAFIGPLVTVTPARVGIYQCADPECDH